MKPGLRKFTLVAHIVLSVGWLGAVVAYLALAVCGLTNTDTLLMRAAYLSMDLIVRDVIVPLSLATLAAGLVEALGTGWGLFRHWWVSAKFLLTTGATLVLLRHVRVVSQVAAAAREATFSVADSRMLRTQLIVHAAGGLVVLLAITVLSVYKPWGMTPYGEAVRQKRRKIAAPAMLDRPVVAEESGAGGPRWAYIVGLHVLGLAVLFLVVHVAGGRMPGH